MASGLSSLFDKYLPNVVYNDEDDTCRVVGKPKYIEDLIEPCILPIMEAGQDKSDIMHHVLNKLEVLALCKPSKAAREKIVQLTEIAAGFIKRNFKDDPVLEKDLKKYVKSLQKFIEEI